MELTLDQMKKRLEQPTIAYWLLNVVMICNCDAHYVLVLNLLTEGVKCNACNRTFHLEELTYAIKQVPGQPDGVMGAQIEYKIGRTDSDIIAPGGTLPFRKGH